MKVGANIRKIRILKGYSQEYVADSLDISQKTYSHLENDKSKISLTRLSQIAKLFEVNVIQILTTTGLVDDDVLDLKNELEDFQETRLYSKLINVNRQLENLIEEIKLWKDQQ